MNRRAQLGQENKHDKNEQQKKHVIKHVVAAGGGDRGRAAQTPLDELWEVDLTQRVYNRSRLSD